MRETTPVGFLYDRQRVRPVGLCPVCGGEIYPADRVIGEPGRGTVHEGCADTREPVRAMRLPLPEAERRAS